MAENKDGAPEQPRRRTIDLGRPGPDGYYGSGWDSLDLIWPERTRTVPRPRTAPLPDEDEPTERATEDDEPGGEPSSTPA